MEPQTEAVSSAAQAPPAPAPGTVEVAAPAPGGPPRKKKSQKPDRPLAELAKADVTPWIREAEAVVALDRLRLDNRVEYGQIRPLKTKDVETRVAAMHNNPPTSRIKVTLWEYEMDAQGNGVLPSSALLCMESTSLCL